MVLDFTSLIEMKHLTPYRLERDALFPLALTRCRVAVDDQGAELRQRRHLAIDHLLEDLALTDGIIEILMLL